MSDKKLAVKVIGLLLIVVLVQSLLFTGVFVFQSNKNLNFPVNKSIKSSREIYNVKASENAIYAISRSEKNYYANNISKYDSNLNLIWSQSYDKRFYYVDMMAVNDENVLLYVVDYDQYYNSYYSILNKDGFQLNFTSVQHPEVGQYPRSIIGYESGYLFIFKKFINATVQIKGVLLTSDNTTSVLFEDNLPHVNFEDIYIQSAFYFDSETLEIPIIQQKWNESGSNYIISASYFLEYKINKKSLEQKPSNYLTIAKEVDKHRKPQDGVVAQRSSTFIYNLNYLGLDTFVTHEQTQFNIWTVNENISSYTTNEFISRFRNSYLFINLIDNFQIKNKYYFNIYLTEEYHRGSYSSTAHMPILLIYSQYSFHSTLDYYNYSNFVSEGEQLVSISITHIGNNLVYSGQISHENGDMYYFIKISKIQTSFLDFIFQLPLILKLLIGSILTLPLLSYFRKKSTKVITSSETYPLN